jgi:hypothetical protein
VLDGVAELVREDDGGRERAEGLVQLRHQVRRVVRDVVVVLAAAVEGVAPDVVVGEALAVACPRRAVLRLRLDAAREVLEALVVDPRKLGGPELAQAAGRRFKSLVEVARPLQEVGGRRGRRRTAVIVVIPDGSDDDDGDRS